MKTTLFSFIWLFVAAVVAYDIYWAIEYMESFEHWESNPVALAVYSVGGLTSAITFRLFSVLFLFVTSLCATFVWQWVAVLSAFAIHLYLMTIYLIINLG